MIDNPAEVEATSQVSWALPSCPGGVLPKPPRPAASSARHGSRGAWKPSLVRPQWLHPWGFHTREISNNDCDHE